MNCFLIQRELTGYYYHKRKLELLFEGSEKKAEIIINSDMLSLIDNFDDAFWHNMVQQCHAKILSSICNSECKAFVLSESSLFVWHDRLFIITCGVTQLVKSVEYFLQTMDENCIRQVIYQRKNEYFAPAQFSSFGDDIKRLVQYKSGQAFRFGSLDNHHNYIFHSDHHYTACPTDKTYEFLAYQIGEEATQRLTCTTLTREDIRRYLQLEKLLPGFLLDDYVFSPYGYSINAIKGKDYLTIHITPQENSSYVSVSSSLNLFNMVPTLLAVLRPNAFDLLSFNEEEFQQLVSQSVQHDYVCHSSVYQQLSNGYHVNFSSFVLPKSSPAKPIKLNIFATNNTL